LKSFRHVRLRRKRRKNQCDEQRHPGRDASWLR
jgi:hypothetical protein